MEADWYIVRYSLQIYKTHQLLLSANKSHDNSTVITTDWLLFGAFALSTQL
jgi:hypothetical protein